jgi:hypothetical protein
MVTLADDLVPDQLWGGGGTLAADPASPALRWPASHDPRSQLLRRDRVHGPHLYPVAAAPSPGAGLRLARHGLATAEPVGHGRGV